MKTKPITQTKLNQGSSDSERSTSNVHRFPTSIRTLASLLTLAIFSLFISCDRPETDIASQEVDQELSHALGKGKKETMPGIAKALTSGIQGASGSTVGPDGALYVTEFSTGRVLRVDPQSGNFTTFASGLPLPLIPIGGAWDVAFLGETAFALVMLVGSDIGGTHTVGIYRIDGPESNTPVVDIGQFNLDNPPPPEIDYFVPTGVLYSFQAYRGGFLVADGHLNRVLHVKLDGEIKILQQFGNIVPTGLAVRGNQIYMAEAGPIPHNPEDGRVVSFSPNGSSYSLVASGAPMLLDVEFNRGNSLFALSQGEWDGAQEGSPAIENDGSLLRIHQDGTHTVVSDGLNQPTSLEFIKNTAYITTLAGEVWTIKNAAGPPYGIW